MQSPKIQKFQIQIKHRSFGWLLEITGFDIQSKPTVEMVSAADLLTVKQHLMHEMIIFWTKHLQNYPNQYYTAHKRRVFEHIEQLCLTSITLPTPDKIITFKMVNLSVYESMLQKLPRPKYNTDSKSFWASHRECHM
jgi:hypothetical protein